MGTWQGRPPTHSSSTCFIRRDTLPASLVMRVLHRGGHSKSMHKLVGLIHRKKSAAPRPTGGWMLQVGATEESLKSSQKQAGP